MTFRRPAMSRNLQQRALRRRLPLSIEKLETRCMLMADEVVPIDVIEPIEDDMATTMALECCPCSEILPLDYIPDFASEPLEFLIDPGVEPGDIDSSELMFFSMGFEGVEPLPSEEFVIFEEEVLVTEEPVDVAIESEIATPSPEIPAAKAFAAFGRSPNSLAASIASAFGTVGFASDSSSDNGFIGGRRRGRR